MKRRKTALNCRKWHWEPTTLSSPRSHVYTQSIKKRHQWWSIMISILKGENLHWIPNLGKSNGRPLDNLPQEVMTYRCRKCYRRLQIEFRLRLSSTFTLLTKMEKDVCSKPTHAWIKIISMARDTSKYKSAYSFKIM